MRRVPTLNQLSSIPTNALIELVQPADNANTQAAPQYILASLVTQTLIPIEGVDTPAFFSAAPQGIIGSAAFSNETYKTNWTTFAGPNTSTLADGYFSGQVKRVQLVADGGTGTLIPDNLGFWASITFSIVGDILELMWDGATWRVLDAYNTYNGDIATPVLNPPIS